MRMNFSMDLNNMMKKECRSWWPWNKCNASIENFKYFDNNLNSDWKKYFKLKSMNLKQCEF